MQLEMVEREQGRPILWLHGEDGLDPAAPVFEEVYRRLKELERAPLP